MRRRIKRKGICLFSAIATACMPLIIIALCVGQWKIAGILTIICVVGWSLYLWNGKL